MTCRLHFPVFGAQFGHNFDPAFAVIRFLFRGFLSFSTSSHAPPPFPADQSLCIEFEGSLYRLLRATVTPVAQLQWRGA